MYMGTTHVARSCTLDTASVLGVSWYHVLQPLRGGVPSADVDEPEVIASHIHGHSFFQDYVSSWSVSERTTAIRVGVDVDLRLLILFRPNFDRMDGQPCVRPTELCEGNVVTCGALSNSVFPWRTLTVPCAGLVQVAGIWRCETSTIRAPSICRSFKL